MIHKQENQAYQSISSFGQGISGNTLISQRKGLGEDFSFCTQWWARGKGPSSPSSLHIPSQCSTRLFSVSPCVQSQKQNQYRRWPPLQSGAFELLGATQARCATCVSQLKYDYQAASSLAFLKPESFNMNKTPLS